MVLTIGIDSSVEGTTIFLKFKYLLQSKIHTLWQNNAILYKVTMLGSKLAPNRIC